jgi:hypothetical protein
MPQLPVGTTAAELAKHGKSRIDLNATVRASVTKTFQSDIVSLLQIG